MKKVNFKETLINNSFSIRKVIENLSKSGLQVSFIVDKKFKLEASITDGDIRRGILSGIDLEDSAVKVANFSPTSSKEDALLKEQLQLMKLNRINQLPILNSKGEIVDLIVMSNLEEISKKENLFVIMAGGFGSRLGELTKNCPKPMLELGGKPIMEHIINDAKFYGFKNFLITTHYLPEKIYEYFGDGSKLNISIKYIEEKKPLGTAGALSLIELKNDLPMVVINGDIFSKVDFDNFLDFHRRKNSDLSVAVKYHEERNPFGVLETKAEKILKIIEKPTYKSLVNAGIYILNPTILSNLKKNKFLTMPEIIQQGILEKKEILAYPIYESWSDIGMKEDFLSANKK